VLDQALAQIPDAHRHGTDILIRADSAGSAKAFLAHVRDVRKQGIRTFFSVVYAVTEPVRRAIRAIPDRLWHPALDQDGTLRDGAEVAELTGMVDLDGYPAGTRILVRRERPHHGAQLSLFDQDEGLRHQVVLTDTPYAGGGTAQFLEVRHRGHATVEDHIRCGKSTGFGRFPSRDFAVNTVWLGLSLTAIDLLAWTRILLLDGELATAEPKKLRYRRCTSPPASPAAADACACGYRRPGPGDMNWPRLSTASPLAPTCRLTGKPPPAHDPEDLGETRPPRRDTGMPKQRKGLARLTPDDQRHLITPTETARLSSARKGRHRGRGHLRTPAAAPDVVTLIVRDGSTLVPRRDTVLRTGDELLLITTPETREATERRLRAIGRSGKLARWLGEYGDSSPARGRTLADTAPWEARRASGGPATSGHISPPARPRRPYTEAVNGLRGARRSREGWRNMAEHLPARQQVREKPPTIWEVARLAGVSHQTVSRFLRKDPTVRPETARKVAVAVEELGYRPNQAARTMRTRRSNRLTVILPGSTDRMSPELLRGAADEAHEAGYLLDVVSLEGDAAARAARLESLLQPESTDGILSFTSLGESAAGVTLSDFQVPFVIDGVYDDKMRSLGAFADASSTADLVRHLADLGHQRLVHVTGPPEWASARGRRAVYEATVAELGLESSAVVEGDWSTRSGWEAATRVIAGSGATAVVAASDQMAFGVITGLQSTGVEIPRDVSVCGWDDWEIGRYFRPTLTTVSVNRERQGRHTVRRLLALLRGEPSVGPMDAAELNRVILRESTGPAPARPAA